MLRAKHRVTTPRRLFSVVTGMRRRKSGIQQIGRVNPDEFHAVSGDDGLLVASQMKAGAEPIAGDPLHDGADFLGRLLMHGTRLEARDVNGFGSMVDPAQNRRDIAVTISDWTQFVRSAKPSGNSPGATEITDSSSAPTNSNRVIRANSGTTNIG